MSRPADALPRVIRHDGVDVYAPWCDCCASDRETRWVRLPTEYAGEALLGHWPQASCLRCERVLEPEIAEAFRAREPERLAQRLAELKAGAL